MFFNESYGLNSINVQPSNIGITGDMAGAYRIIAESSEEWYTLREKMMRLEHTALVTEDAALLEAGVGGFFKKIADFFKKLWAKVKELWQKFIVFVNSHTMNAKKFITKYEKVIRNKTYTNFKFKGYQYSASAVATISDGVTELITDAVYCADNIEKPDVFNDIKDSSSSDFTEEARNIVCKSADNDSFAKDVMELLRGSDEPEELDDISVDHIINALKTGDKMISELGKLRTNTDKMYQKIIKTFENASAKFYNATDKVPGEVEITTNRVTDYRKDGKAKFTKGTASINVTDDDHRKNIKDILNKVAEKLRAESNVVNESIGLLIQASKEALNQSKSIAAKMVTWKPEKSESYSFGDSILDRF